MTDRSWFLRSDGQEAVGVRAQVQSLTGRQSSESGALAQRFDEFWAVRNDDIATGAVALARLAGGLGLPALSFEQRQRMARAGTVPQPLWFGLFRAAQTQPLVEQRAGVTGAGMLLLGNKEAELRNTDAALTELGRQVGDSRRLLQGIQFTAQQRVLGCLAEELIVATPAERLALLGDAGLLLDAVDAQLKVVRDGQKAGEKATAEEAAALAEANEDLLLMKTLRSLKAGEDIDEDILRRAALRYAERGAVPGPKAPQAPATKPAANKPRKSRRGR